MFLPSTQDELNSLGWQHLDVILVTGDAYIDSPLIGVALIGKVLLNAGYKVGVIAQPSIDSTIDISRLGEPKLFWGVTAGCVDSLVSNRTATGKKRRSDDFTPGGQNTRRPDRACIAYSNLIRRCFKGTSPIVLGGIEASLRRVAHYDFWTDRVRKSILFDAKANYLLYGMAERSTLELAECLSSKNDPSSIRGLCYISSEKPENALELPDFQSVANDKAAFTEMFHQFYKNTDPVTASSLVQKHDQRFLVQNPPQAYLSQDELDATYALEFHRELHPFHQKDGKVKALETIRFSLSAHRGCYGECNFCAIAVHQGRMVRCRSKRSLIAEARVMTSHPKFKGTIHDVGGPSANMYGIECDRKSTKGACPKRRCLHPTICSSLKTNHKSQIDLLRELREIPKVKRVIVASGIRHDLVLADQRNGHEYLRQLTRHHVSGQLKLAPEHSELEVLEKMGKPGIEALLKFKTLFDDYSQQGGKKQFLTYYFIAAHPGCSELAMKKLKSFAIKELGILPEQVQVFTPTPSTYSTLMYWTEQDPFTGEPCIVEKSFSGKEKQKAIITGTNQKAYRGHRK